MAAVEEAVEGQIPDWLTSLPDSWSFGITPAGRLFFINEEAKSTTWLHPVTGEAILTGHRKTPDLPTGWEEGYTFEGARYYINHNERKVTCKHPVTAQPSQDNCIFVVNDQTASAMTSQEKKDRTVSMTSDGSNCNAVSATHPTSPLTRSSRASGKVHNFGKRSNSIKRNPNAPVSMRSWLYKKANSGMKLWKKRWFVLSDLCLFYYRDEKEEGVLGSILLPSFKISPVTADDHINRIFAFKAAHSNMRTYYFCTDTGREMELWMKVMTDASLVHSEPTKRVDVSKCEYTAPQEMNHVPNHRLLIRPEANNNQRNQELVREEEKRAQEAERYGFKKEGQERPLTKINSVRLSEYEMLAASTAQYRSMRLNGPDNRHVETQGHNSQTDGADRAIQRTSSMQQLEQWIQMQREKPPEEDSRGVLSYQTLPRNMPSYRAQIVPRYPEGYRTLPRNPKPRPDSLCSTTGGGHERGMISVDEKRRSIRDDTMWQLYEWQQRQFYNKQTTLRRHSSLTSPKTMIHISEQTLHSIPLSPSHGSISGYHTYSPHRAYRSEVSSPVQRGDITIDRRQKTLPSKATYVPDRRSMPAGLSLQPVTQQGLQDKTPEELTLLLIKLRRQQAELGTIREHTLAQILRLKQPCSPQNQILSHHLQRNLLFVDYQMKENDPLISMVHTMIENCALRPQLYQQMTQDECRAPYKQRAEDLDVDAKLSRLCEQDKVVQALEQKLQQLHKEKYTLEQALLSASQEIEMNAVDSSAMQNVVLQRDELQNGLLSTCREVSRAMAELERLWREYDHLEREVTTARNQMRDQLDRLGEVQTESAGIQRAQMQKEIWRIQDVMEGLSKHKQQRDSEDGGSALWDATSGDGWSATSGDGWSALWDVTSGDGWSALWDVTSGDGWSATSGDGWSALWDVTSGDGWSALWDVTSGDGWSATSGDGWSATSGDGWSALWDVTSCRWEICPGKELVPPRPPLPRSYSEQPPSIPPSPSDSSSSFCQSRGPVHLPDEKTTHQFYPRNGSYCGPDYRLYKSEPELTTVAEVDESNGEERADPSLDIETVGKGSHFPVGVVPPRTKSPPLESMTIASYVTLRKNKKLESKSERPRSAMEHLCIADSVRPRMTLEEQLERMRRHQQACLKEKKRGLNFLGGSEQSPTQIPPFSQENSLKVSQVRKREDKLFNNIQDIENAVRDDERRESPAQEIMRLKEAASVEDTSDKEEFSAKEESSIVSLSEAKEENMENIFRQTDSDEAGQTFGGSSVHVTNHKPEINRSRGSAMELERGGILFSYDLRRHGSLDAGDLSSLPDPPTLGTPQAPLTEGTHFMCV
ncbi:pleckstrin homology domain-containing family A member 5 [Pelodytes ibericus]